MSPPPIAKMNNHQLIQHIKIRRALWDKALWDRIDGSAREVMWEDVADQMKSLKEIVKARWKNLRDSYRKLLLRALNHPLTEGHPRWRYFRHMDFIKDIVLNTKPKVSDISLKNSELMAIEPNYSLALETNLSNDSVEDPLSFPNDSHGASGPCTNEVKVEKGLKRKSVEDGDTDAEKSDLSEKFGNYPNDDDLQFLLSLYPHFKQVAMNKKLPLRMKIEKLVYEEIYSNNNGCANFPFKF